MNTLESSAEMYKRITNRRAFVKGVGLAGLGVAGANMMGCSSAPAMAASSGTDTAQQIFTAALIAEDLATTFYFTGLTTDAIIQDPNLAGAGGSATSVQPGGAVDDVGYIRAALSEEIMHADLLRSLMVACQRRAIRYRPSSSPTAHSQASLIGWARSKRWRMPSSERT